MLTCCSLSAMRAHLHLAQQYTLDFECMLEDLRKLQQTVSKLHEERLATTARRERLLEVISSVRLPSPLSAVIACG